ncbi:MAG: IgGFc-binding protein, partial [Myxococcota bacterium]
REVDGSPPGQFNAGTDTALTRNAYKVESDFPVVVYQFNPLENVNVFSNDASLLKPVEALTSAFPGPQLSYVVASWPQTISITNDPDTNFSTRDPINLRSFLTIVGSRPDTEVTVFPTTQVKAGTGIEDVRNGLPITFTLQPYEVANLETPDVNAFGADFTGTQIIADGPVSVYTGSEASDAPAWPDLSERRCCADHLEEQLDPLRTAGRSYAFAHSPSRTAAVVAAGGGIQSVAEPEYVRFVAATNEPTVVRTTLPAPFDRLTLDRLGDHVDVESTTDFLADADFPVHAIQVMASQDAVNIPRELPGGDPSLLVVPPREQFRERYVFLTPDKYAFDFISIIAPRDATVVLDDAFVSDQQCEVRPTDGLSVEERGEDVVPELFTYTCQLSFAVVDPTTGDITEGVQNDGVHRVESDRAVGVIVFGFDRFVSYAYAAGTELQEIAAPL